MRKMFYTDRIRLTEENYSVYTRAENLLMTSYVNCTNDDDFEGYIEVEDVESMVEELCDKIEDLEEKIKDMEQDIEDNYVSRPMSDYTGDSYDDRF